MRLNTPHTGRIATREKKDAEVGHSESTNQRINESTTEVVKTLGGGAGFVYSSIRPFAQYPPAHCAGRVLFPPARGPLRFQVE